MEYNPQQYNTNKYIFIFFSRAQYNADWCHTKQRTNFRFKKIYKVLSQIVRTNILYYQ